MEELTDNIHIFSGEYQHALDDKNRVTIPAVWRQRTDGEEFHILPDQRNQYLKVLPPSELRNVKAKVEANEKIDATAKRTFLKFFYAKARRCVTDRQGRIVLPDDYKDATGLNGEVMMVGVHSHIEVWAPERWSEFSETEHSVYEQVAELVGL